MITTWLVNDGGVVKEGALIAEIMTAKVQYEINAPVSGTISICAAADAVVPKGTVMS